MFPHFILHGFCHLHLINFSKKREKARQAGIHSDISRKKKKKRNKNPEDICIWLRSITALEQRCPLLNNSVLENLHTAHTERKEFSLIVRRDQKGCVCAHRQSFPAESNIILKGITEQHGQGPVLVKWMLCLRSGLEHGHCHRGYPWMWYRQCD